MTGPGSNAPAPPDVSNKKSAHRKKKVSLFGPKSKAHRGGHEYSTSGAPITLLAKTSASDSLLHAPQAAPDHKEHLASRDLLDVSKLPTSDAKAGKNKINPDKKGPSASMDFLDLSELPDSDSDSLKRKRKPNENRHLGTIELTDSESEENDVGKHKKKRTNVADLKLNLKNERAASDHAGPSNLKSSHSSMRHRA